MAVLRHGFTTRVLIVACIVALGAVLAFVGRQMLNGTGAALDSEGFPRGAISYDFVKSLPDAHLFYPGARVVNTSGASEDRNPAQPNPAFASTVLTTGDTPDAVYAWYRSHLTQENPPWQQYDIPSLTTQVSARGFKRGRRERFSVGIDDPKLLGETLGREVPAGGTVFEVALLIYPSQN